MSNKVKYEDDLLKRMAGQETYDMTDETVRRYIKALKGILAQRRWHRRAAKIKKNPEIAPHLTDLAEKTLAQRIDDERERQFQQGLQDVEDTLRREKKNE